MNNNQPTEDDRRNYFRIRDRVKISFYPVPKDELTDRIERLETDLESKFTVMSSCSLITQQMMMQLRRIESDLPDVAACIKALDDKLNLIGRAFLTQEEDFSNQVTEQVNISAGGIALNSDEEIKLGTVLEIKLLLLPAMTGLLLFGEVIACKKKKKSDGKDCSYRLRIDFSYMREPDRDILIRHVLQRQGEWLRKRREEHEMKK